MKENKKLFELANSNGKNYEIGLRWWHRVSISKIAIVDKKLIPSRLWQQHFELKDQHGFSYYF